MLSIPEMAALGVAALMLFGPEQLPRVARRAGNVMREIQNTSQSFIREMERAADLQDAAQTKPYDPASYDPAPYDAAAYDDSPTIAMSAVQPPAPDPDTPAGNGVSEKLAEPRPAALAGAESDPGPYAAPDPAAARYAAVTEPGPALRLIYGEPLSPPPARAEPAVNGVAAHGSAPAQPAPQGEDPPNL
jgi:sec-independent protein translocase protein TatB